jgi:hypothetical protein
LDLLETVLGERLLHQAPASIAGKRFSVRLEKQASQTV